MSVPEHDDPYALVPELGDLLTIVSDAHGTLTGRIHYRDCQVIRVKPTHVSDRAVDFPVDPETGLFRELLGVKEIIMHEKAKYAHFAKQLAVVPGERLEFFSVTGVPVAETGVVAEVVASETEDSIRLEDGRVLTFDFLGPPPPIEVIRQRAMQEDQVAPENNTATGELEIPEVPEDVFPEIDYSLLPAAMVDEVPTAEQTYSDSLQREDMFVSLLRQVSPAQQKNPRILRQLYRITDLMLALKNSMVVRDAEGTVQPGAARSYMADTVRDALAKQPTGGPLASLLPVADVKKILYTDNTPEELRAAVRENVTLRSDILNLQEAVQMMTSYRTDTGSTVNQYLAYLDFLLGHQLASFEPSSAAAAQGPRIQVDQDVLRSVLPPAPVEGFPGDLPSARAWNLSRRARAQMAEDPEETAAKFLVKTSNLARIQDRSARLLAPTTYRNPSTGQIYQLAPADVAATVGHIVLTPELSAYRAPIRSSNLLWDIQASERSRSQPDPFYTLLMGSWGDQKVLLSKAPSSAETDEAATQPDREEEPEPDLSLVDVLEGRLPQTFNIASRGITDTLDSLGLRNLEITQPVFEKVVASVNAGRQTWEKGMAELRARALRALENTGDVASSMEDIPTSDPLWTADVLSNAHIQQALESLKARETELVNTQLARASFFGSRTNGTLADLWYALAAGPELQPNGVEPVDMEDIGIPKQPSAIERAQAAYLAEKRRLERTEANVRAASAAIKAQPDLNSCQHVHLLESIRSIRDLGKRMAIFEDFVTKYRSGQQNNWVMCGNCDKNLVCRHELLLLHEFQHPGRGVALHKALLLEFGGPVFEGAYICKNCGQKIAELEYDTHMEYDDEGRPMVGRTVIEGVEDETGGAPEGAGVMEEEGRLKDTHGFTGTQDVGYFYLTRTILEHCGITPTDDLYQRIVKGVRDFMNDRVPPESYWKNRMKPADDSKKQTTYSEFRTNILFGTVGALVTLEILTTDIAIPFPMHGCVFQRGGFPLETEGDGTLKYVACVIAGVLRNDVPWTQASWAADTNLEKRKVFVANAIRQSMITLLAIQPAQGKGAPPLTTVTEFYKTAIAARRNVLAQQEFDETGATLASHADRLPASFRPLQIQPREHGNASAIRSVGALEKDAQSAPIAEILPVIRGRLEQLVREQVSKHHLAVTTSAKSLGVLSAASPRSDAFCCLQRVGAVAATGLGVVRGADAADAEEAVLAAAGKMVRRRDPASSANGTHLFVPWSAPPTYILQPAVDASNYYRLFLVHCARGENMGGVHEWGEDLICRQCRFALPTEFTYLTASEIAETNGGRLQKALDSQAARRKELALAALAAQSISVDEAAFQALDDAIHLRKQIVPVVPPVLRPFMTLLEMAQTHFTAQGTPLLSSAAADWDLLQKVMTTIASKHLPSSNSSIQRKSDFSAFVERHDDMLAAMEGRFLSLLHVRHTPTPAQKALVKRAMDALTFFTANVEGAQAARDIITHIVVPLEQVAKGFQLNGAVVSSQAGKWFPRMNKSHEQTLESIWNRQILVQKRAAEWMDRLPPNTRILVQGVYQRIAGWLGKWSQFWIEHIRVSDAGFSASEYSLVLRWSLLHVLAALLTDESGLYAAVYTDVRQQAIEFSRDVLLDLLSSKQADLAPYHMSAKEVQESLLARQELEKNMFIQRFDKLDREMRQVELMKKRLKIGDWAVGTTKNLHSYDADFYEFERAQRAAMGLPEFAADITRGADERGVAEETGANAYGLGLDTGPEAGYDHRAAHDED